MRKFILILLCMSINADAQMQACLPGGTPPPVPPKPTGITISFPAVDGGSFVLPDGGTFACIGYAQGGVATPQSYGGKPAQCAVARSLGDQWVANDNAWNDGGVP